MMTFSIQPFLENNDILLQPLEENDFEGLYLVASDRKVWEQHPNKDRYKREVFLTFFEGAILSKGAFKIIDKSNGEIIGSTRFYDYDPTNDSIFIGYTFYGVQSWGRGINPSVKILMLDYIFQYVSKAQFHIGAQNMRSQIAIGRLGAVKVTEQEVSYFGEAPKLNFVYELTRDSWQAKS